MYNILYNNYDDFKPKKKKAERTFSYDSQMMVQLGQIVRLDNFKDKLDLDLDVALNIKLTEGIVGITKKNDTFYLLFSINPIGLPRKDGRPKYVIANYFDENQNLHVEQFENDVDCVLWYNNSLANSETTIKYFSYMFTEIDTSIEYNVQHARYNLFLKAKNEKQKRQYEDALKATHDGVPQVIVDSEDFSLEDETEPTLELCNVAHIDKVQYLSHLHDDMLKRFSNLYGVSMNMSSKQAQQTEKEISGMESFSWLIPLDMLNQAKEFCDRMMNLYSIELRAHFGTVHEFNFSKFTNDCTVNDDTMNEDINEVDEEIIEDEEIEENESGVEDDENNDL